MRAKPALLASALAAASLPALVSAQEDGGALVEVARFEHQVTGVTVSEDGRIFVNFPRWTEDTPISVAEVVDGAIKSYPDEAWNSWRNAKKNEIGAGDHFVSVQSVVADGRGSLWVLDPAAPATSFIVKGGPKLVRIDLTTNKVAEIIPFDETAAPQGSYLNDLRFSPDGRFAFITDSGPKGALVVADLERGTARRLLEEHPATLPDPKVVVAHKGEPLRRPDGRGAEFAADSIELSDDGETLFFKPLTGRMLFSIPTALLTDESASPDQLAAGVREEGEVGVTDGFWLKGDRLYLSAVEEDAVKVLEGGSVSTLIADERLRWPDTFSQGPDGAIFVTTSRIMDMSWYKPENPTQLETQLWKFDPQAVSSTTP